MYIVREGEEIELTKEELVQAYMEQRKNYIREDIENYMSLKKDSYELLKNERAVDYAIGAYEKYEKRGHKGMEAIKLAVDESKEYFKRETQNLEQMQSPKKKKTLSR